MDVSIFFWVNEIVWMWYIILVSNFMDFLYICFVIKKCVRVIHIAS